MRLDRRRGWRYRGGHSSSGIVVVVVVVVPFKFIMIVPATGSGVIDELVMVPVISHTPSQH